MTTHQNTEKTAGICSADIKQYGIPTILESKSNVLFKTVQIIDISTPVISDETLLRQQYSQKEYLEKQFKKLQGNNDPDTPETEEYGEFLYTKDHELSPFGFHYDSDYSEEDDDFVVHIVSLSGPKYEWKEQWYKIDIDKMFCSQMWMRYIKLREKQFEYLTTDHLRNEYFDKNIEYLQRLLEGIADERCYENYFYHIKQKEYDVEKEFEKYGSTHNCDGSDSDYDSDNLSDYDSDGSCDSSE